MLWNRDIGTFGTFGTFGTGYFLCHVPFGTGYFLHLLTFFGKSIEILKKI